MNLNKLRDKAYQCAVAHGWHEENLSDEHFLCLVISELMEAVEADRKGKHANRVNFEYYMKQRKRDDGEFMYAFKHGIKDSYNPQIQISVVSGTKRSIFRQKNKTKRSKKRLHTTLIKPEQKVNEDLCSGFIVS